MLVYTSLWWSAGPVIVPCCQSNVITAPVGCIYWFYSGPGWFHWSLVVRSLHDGLCWSGLFVLSAWMVHHVLCCGALAWSNVVIVMCSGPELWFWASSTHDHLRCSLQLRLRLCLTSQMKVSFYEAGDVPAVWLHFRPDSLLNLSRQNLQNQ